MTGVGDRFATSSREGQPRLIYEPSTHVGPVDATIGLTTKDRCAELLVAIESAMRQRDCRYEVVVVDDGSTDETAAQVPREFPSVAVYRSDSPRGCAAQRSFIASVARGPLIISIDDDAELVDPRTLAQSLRDFEAGPEIGAVAIPYRELTLDGEWVEVQPSGGDDVEIVDSFIGTAYAVRKDLFVSLGGFWEYSRNEERDFCVRMLQAGYLVRRGTGPHLLHRPSQVRNWHREAFTGRRNDLIFAYRNVPRASLPWHLARTTGNAVRSALVIGHGRYARQMALGYIAGWSAFAHEPRAPVSEEVYRLHQRLRRHGPLRLSEIERRDGATPTGF